MKIQYLTTALAFASADAFLAPTQPQALQASSTLQGQKNDWVGPAAATLLGWTLASQAAFASVPTETQQFPSLTVSVEKLDFSLPSYEGIGANEGGFGVGSEARLTGTSSMTDPGANEKAKQEEAMRKAEQARLERKAAEKKAKIARTEDQIRLADEKKKQDAQKVAAFFAGEY